VDHPNQESEELKQIIRELYDYVKDHVKREAQLMQALGYPELKGHREKYENIVRDMNHHPTASHHMAVILDNFRQLVDNWVISHIMEKDKKLACSWRLASNRRPAKHGHSLILSGLY